MWRWLNKIVAVHPQPSADCKLKAVKSVKAAHTTTTTPQPFYGPFSGTTQVSRCQNRTSGFYGARED